MNNVLVYYSPNADHTVVYFPGDIQTFQVQIEEMFIQYSFENTIEILRNKYNQCNIVLVAPSRVQEGGFSCFGNFTPNMTSYGAVQAYEADGHACEYFLKLLAQVNLLDQRLHLLGFSKGGVVLNQFVAELGHISDKSRSAHRVFSMTETMHWIDSGNGSLVYALPVADSSAVANLSSYQIEVFIHTTPFQMKSTQRPWIKTEVETFLTLLKQHEIRVHWLSYFEQQDADDLNSHFHVLSGFKVSQ